MGSFVRLKIVRRVYDLTTPGYSNAYRLYLAEEVSPAPFNRYANNVYLLSTDDYRNGYHINLDESEQEDFNNKSGMLNGNRVFVQKDRPIALEGHFKVKHSVDATEPLEHFRSVSIRRNEYVLYQTEHIRQGKSSGLLSRVFSKVSPGYMNGEDIPAYEVMPIHRLGASDGHNYYIHDHAKYLKRLMEAMPKC